MLTNEVFRETVSKWPLMASPAPMVLIFSAYLCYVLKVGPEYMKNRKPMDLTTFTRLYNIFQVIACSTFIYLGYTLGFSLQSAWTCVDRSLSFDYFMKYKETQWFFLLLRLAELSETVVFVLRKKQNQVSVLHVYHHISTATIVWLMVKYSPSYMDFLPAVLNSMVHVVMYFYYFASSFKAIIHLTNKIKPFITIIQLLQLFIIIGHTVAAVLPSCNASNLYHLQLVNVALLIALFSNFYAQSYVGKKSIKNKVK